MVVVGKRSCECGEAAALLDKSRPHSVAPLGQQEFPSRRHTSLFYRAHGSGATTAGAVKFCIPHQDGWLSADLGGVHVRIGEAACAG